MGGHGGGNPDPPTAIKREERKKLLDFTSSKNRLETSS